MNKKGMEIQTLIFIVLTVVFLLIMLTVTIVLFTDGNPFTGPNNICERTGWLIKGCS